MPICHLPAFANQAVPLCPIQSRDLAGGFALEPPRAGSMELPLQQPSIKWKCVRCISCRHSICSFDSAKVEMEKNSSKRLTLGELSASVQYNQFIGLDSAVLSLRNCALIARFPGYGRVAGWPGGRWMVELGAADKRNCRYENKSHHCADTQGGAGRPAWSAPKIETGPATGASSR